jgi:hypothetical protein
MAGRIRTIKPEVLSDAEAARLSHAAWRLWVSSWVLSDDEGRLPADPDQLHGQVFWGCPADIHACLVEIESKGLAMPYVAGGDIYLAITNFRKHQKINRPSGAKHPEPEGSYSFLEPPHGGLSEGSVSQQKNSLRDRDRDRDLDHDRDRDHDHVEPRDATHQSTESNASNGSPPARQRVEPHPRASEIADDLRERICTEKPDHSLSQEPAWRSKRLAWIRQISTLLCTDERDPDRALEVLRWVFGDQGGRDFRFVVQSPKSLREKWDRIEAAMVQTSRTRGVGQTVRDPAAEIMAYALELERRGE